MFRSAPIVAGLALILAGAARAPAADASLETIGTPRGARQSFILIWPPRKPEAAVVLFAGGHGALGLAGPGSMRWGNKNFLVRSRDMFAARGFVVAVPDAPSDRHKGMNAVFRMSTAHTGDIGAIVGYLKQKIDIPVWLVGTSMGTFSATAGAIGSANVGGVVLTSTITRAKPRWDIAQSHPDGVASMPLSRISVPALIVSHRKDGCDITPAADAPKLKARLTRSPRTAIVLLDGGAPPQSEPCEAMSQHGYLGIEEKTVDAIAKFIKN